MEKSLQPEQYYDMFAASKYGEHLHQQTRFGDFQPDFVTNEMWLRLLGPDVNNLFHMPYTADLADTFATMEKMPAVDRDLLVLTAMTHDWAEAIVGDIALPSKTEESEQEEFEAFRKLAKDLGAASVAGRVLPVLSGEHELSTPFKAVEYIGYCKTGERAGKVGRLMSHKLFPLDLSRANREQLTGALLGMARAIDVNDYPKLSKFAETYRSIGGIMEC